VFRNSQSRNDAGNANGTIGLGRLSRVMLTFNAILATEGIDPKTPEDAGLVTLVGKASRSRNLGEGCTGSAHHFLAAQSAGHLFVRYCWHRD
jgi:hypothetical protein